jgi:hypothetical protein
MKPIIPILLSLRDKPGNRKSAVEFNGEEPAKTLSDKARYVLTACLEVTVKYDLKDLEDLLLNHKVDINQAVRSIAPAAMWTPADSVIESLKKKLNLKKRKRQAMSVPLNRFPTLNSQWEKLEQRAPSGWETAPEMGVEARKQGIELVRLEEGTLDTYRRALEIGLAHIPCGDDLDVRELLVLETVEVVTDGFSTTKRINPLVEKFRQREQERESKSKRAGYDSSVFVNFTSAVKTLAAFNGIFHLQKDFRDNYTAIADNETRRKNKSDIKRTFSLKWLDDVIDTLGVEFFDITEKGKFKRENPNYTPRETRQALRFCFFYVWLVTLRYMGFRQQCLRNCEYNRNICFKDGTIVLRWETDEIKNDKIWEVTLHPEQHKLTHGKLIRVLTEYHEKVYKYLLKTDSETMENQFFLRLNRQNRARRFKEQLSGDFYSVFINHSRKHIKFEEIVSELKTLILKPHSFRGLAGDWYHDVLLLDIEETAKALGDARLTVERKYLRNDQHIATPILDAVNRVLGERNGFDGDEIKNYRRLMEEERQSAISRAENAERRCAELEGLLNIANREIISLREQLSRS